MNQGVRVANLVRELIIGIEKSVGLEGFKTGRVKDWKSVRVKDCKSLRL